MKDRKQKAIKVIWKYKQISDDVDYNSFSEVDLASKEKLVKAINTLCGSLHIILDDSKLSLQVLGLIRSIGDESTIILL